MYLIIPIYRIFSSNNFNTYTGSVFVSGCHTVKGSGKYPDMPCVMSWTYPINGVNYTGCANPDDVSGGDWCPTEVNEAGEYEPKSEKWGYCNSKCPRDHEGKSKNNYLI